MRRRGKKLKICKVRQDIRGLSGIFKLGGSVVWQGIFKFS
ncbi:hypothetical protein KKC1_13440 [Calderihabitans maritimus]|uniref:Uncharacterized protein n=1 Tax=Calderihabitans maritimus TaxID=1246530 RepID=A0A1Z5HS84_9FIRM|nr:hypothetical protein KKC1_13440 [Calderihabitans maritimus]